jgi:hypothetical protein
MQVSNAQLDRRVAKLLIIENTLEGGGYIEGRKKVIIFMLTSVTKCSALAPWFRKYYPTKTTVALNEVSNPIRITMSRIDWMNLMHNEVYVEDQKNNLKNSE